jgi:LysM repeat protein
MCKKCLLLIAILALLSLGQFTNPVHAQQETPELTILLEDEFDVPELWAVVSESSFSTRYVDNTYEIRNSLPGASVSSVRPGNLRNGWVEVVVQSGSGTPEAFYGAVCRWQDAQNFYAAVVNNAGQAAIFRLDEGAPISIASGTIQRAGSDSDRVGVLCVGDRLRLVLNGQVALEARDGAFTSGSAGMVVMGDTGEAGIRFDYFLLAAVNEGLSVTPVEFFPGIEPDEQLYIVRHTDTLQEIAGKFEITLADLMERNPQILDPDLVYGGQMLAIPAGAAVLEDVETEVIPQTGAPAQIIHPPDLHPNVSVPIFHGEFEDEDAWLGGPDEPDQMEYEDGEFQMTQSSSQSFFSRVRPFDLPLVHVEVEIQHGGGAEAGFYGVVCRWQDADNFYAFVIGDGRPRILRIQNGTVNELVQSRIEVERSEWNRVGANCYGPLLTMYLNGAAVVQTNDPIFESGYPGIVVGTGEEPGTSARFTNLTAYIPASVVTELER